VRRQWRLTDSWPSPTVTRVNSQSHHAFALGPSPRAPLGCAAGRFSAPPTRCLQHRVPPVPTGTPESCGATGFWGFPRGTANGCTATPATIAFPISSLIRSPLPFKSAADTGLRAGPPVRVALLSSTAFGERGCRPAFQERVLCVCCLLVVLRCGDRRAQPAPAVPRGGVELYARMHLSGLPARPEPIAHRRPVCTTPTLKPAQQQSPQSAARRPARTPS
jgi:hypothetical protein